MARHRRRRSELRATHWVVALGALALGALACADAPVEADQDEEASEPSADEPASPACGLQSDQLLAADGSESGDRLEQIDGAELDTPDAALDAYARLRKGTTCTEQLTRRGEAQVSEPSSE